MTTMLSPENICAYTPDAKKYPAKAFACQFYAVKTFLYSLLEQKALICFRSIVPKGQKPFHIFLQPRGADFEMTEAKPLEAIL